MWSAFIHAGALIKFCRINFGDSHLIFICCRRSMMKPGTFAMQPMCCYERSTLALNGLTAFHLFRTHQSKPNDQRFTDPLAFILSHSHSVSSINSDTKQNTVPIHLFQDCCHRSGALFTMASIRTIPANTSVSFIQCCACFNWTIFNETICFLNSYTRHCDCQCGRCPILHSRHRFTPNRLKVKQVFSLTNRMNLMWTGFTFLYLLLQLNF